MLLLLVIGFGLLPNPLALTGGFKLPNRAARLQETGNRFKL